MLADFPMATLTLSRAAEFRERLASRVLVADGAMGTMLYSRGVFINRCFDELNLSSPDLVAADSPGVRQGRRRDPGDQHLRRQPRRAWRPSASPRSCGDINRAGVRWRAKRRANGAFVAGAVGPLGVRIEPLGPTSFAEARATFREQIEALAGSRRRSADPRNLRQSRRAARSRVRRARSRRRRDIAIVAQVTIDDFGHLPGGTDHRNLHPRDGLLAGGRHRPQLLGRPQGHARNHRAHDAVLLQADERHAQRRLAACAWRAATSISARPSTWRSTRAACCGPA